MAISSFRRSTTGASSSETISEANLVVQQASTWYKAENSFDSGTFNITKNAGFDFSLMFVNGTELVSAIYIDSNTTTQSIAVGSSGDAIWYKSDSASGSLAYASAGAAPPTDPANITSTIQQISNSQTVTFNHPTEVLAIGGGGNGGNVATDNTNNRRQGGGGGSGYIDQGILAPGTYNIVIGGGGGGTTTVGNTISAAGGSGGQSNSENPRGGDGGSGGGGANANGSTSWTRGSGGFQGNDGNSNNPGIGSGVAFSSGVVGGTFDNVGAANSGTSGGGGIYGGGGAAASSMTGFGPAAYGGSSANGPGGGGQGRGGVNFNGSGGSGAAGAVWYREVTDA